MSHGHKGDRARTVEIPAGEFKSRCLKLMEEVRLRRISIVVTKRGRRVAKLVPADDEPPALFGCMRDTGSAKGDIVAGTGEVWDADS